MLKTDIKSLTIEELKTKLLEMGEKPFRGKQIYGWLHEKQALSFEEMSNLSLELRRRLAERFTLTHLEMVRVQESAVDGTRKYLLRLYDGNLIESVWMRYHHGNSICISSQAGCRMGCSFCASTLDGLARNLTPAEMLEQVYAVTRHTGQRISHVVVMGTGEPLDNYDSLLRFLCLLTGEGGLHISQRNVTVSTCGIVPNIYRLAREKLQITLALSLHAVTDEKRQSLMPVARRYPLDEVLAACEYYQKETGWRLTLEYSLIRGINDSGEDAAGLAAIAGKCGFHVNLIAWNPVSERGFAPPQRAQVEAFQNKLEKNGINVTIRREMGRDIDGACGQLRYGYSRGNSSDGSELLRASRRHR